MLIRSCLLLQSHPFVESSTKRYHNGHGAAAHEGAVAGQDASKAKDAAAAADVTAYTAAGTTAGASCVTIAQSRAFA